MSRAIYLLSGWQNADHLNAEDFLLFLDLATNRELDFNVISPETSKKIRSARQLMGYQTTNRSPIVNKHPDQS